MGSQLIVAGFHRSGTSATARIFHHAGVHLGDELVGERLSNPFGHYEDVAVVRIHQSLLADNGRDWQIEAELLPAISTARWEEMQAFIVQREEGNPLWGFKDPRVCVFLQAWKHLLPEARIVAVYRHYADAVDSLHRREAGLLLAGSGNLDLHRRFWEVPALALRMWMVHNRALLEFADAHRDDVLTVSFDAVQAGAPLVDEAERRWQLGLRPAETFEAVSPGFPGVERSPIRVADPGLIREADEVLAGLQALERATLGEGGADA